MKGDTGGLGGSAAVALPVLASCGGSSFSNGFVDSSNGFVGDIGVEAGEMTACNNIRFSTVNLWFTLWQMVYSSGSETRRKHAYKADLCQGSCVSPLCKFTQILLYYLNLHMMA